MCWKNLNRDVSVIPEGIYCYDKYGTCRYWTLIANKPAQDNGYCFFLERGDWEIGGISLLWDKCKECGVNIGSLE